MHEPERSVLSVDQLNVDLAEQGADEFSIDLDIDVATSDDEEGSTNFTLLDDMGTCQRCWSRCCRSACG